MHARLFPLSPRLATERKNLQPVLISRQALMRYARDSLADCTSPGFEDLSLDLYDGVSRSTLAIFGWKSLIGLVLPDIAALLFFIRSRGLQVQVVSSLLNAVGDSPGSDHLHRTRRSLLLSPLVNCSRYLIDRDRDQTTPLS